MKTILSPEQHRFVDFVTVFVFAFAPAVFSFGVVAAITSYVLAVVHLGLTFVTAFPQAKVKLVPLPWHGRIEFLVGVVLIALALFGGAVLAPVAQYFYGAIGVIILLVWAVTQYENTRA